MNSTLKTLCAVCAVSFLCRSICAAEPEIPSREVVAKSRVFNLRYGATLKNLQQFEQVRVWLPMPTSDSYQDVTLVENPLPAGSYQITHDRKFGNSILYFEVDPKLDEFQFHLDYRIERKEARTLHKKQPANVATPLVQQQRQFYLQPNRLVPITGKPLLLLPPLGSQLNVLQQARLLYDRVDSLVSYDKSKPGYGDGDVLWVCDSRTGNCSDFHSLFISLARSQAIPARFEIGFPLPAERGAGKIGGYHCWAWFFDQQHGWVPVDISEADKHPEMKDYFFSNLTENRVALSLGRDIELEPRQAGPPLNFFINPYVEADGQVFEKFKTSYEYQDVNH